MKLISFSLLVTISLHASTDMKEGDLQAPISDSSKLSRQEQEAIPTIEEVEMRKTPKRKSQREELQKKVNHSKPWTSY